MMAEICCTKAVYDDQAGWWCPIHGDQWDVTPDPDYFWREEKGES